MLQVSELPYHDILTCKAFDILLLDYLFFSIPVKIGFSNDYTSTLNKFTASELSMAVKVAVVNSLGITDAAWRIQKLVVRENSANGAIVSEFEFLAPDESQFFVLQSDISKLTTSVNTQTMGVYMQDGTQLSLQGSLTMSLVGHFEASVGNDVSSSGMVGMYIGIGVVGGSVAVGGVIYLIKKFYCVTNTYVVWTHLKMKLF